MILKPRASRNPPIDIELFVTNGSVHSAVSSTNMYGFYRLEDIDNMGNRVSDVSSGTGGGTGNDGEVGNPWLSVDTVIVEKVDFKRGRSLRFARIEVPDGREQSDGMSDGRLSRFS